MKICALLLLGVSAMIAASRTSVDLGGSWELGESVSLPQKPEVFRHRAPVPGLVHSAVPRFPGVNEFESFELNNHRADRKMIPESARMRTGRGVSKQQRNYFWYRRTFRAPAKSALATLSIKKAQFGVSVWLNGRHLGEHTGCFTTSFYDATRAIRWSAENELIVRIGAHPGVLPEGVACGQDGEKNRWTPGIYDDVSLFTSNLPAIVSVQVAPRIAEGAALVQTRIRNPGNVPVSFGLTNTIRERISGRISGRSAVEAVTIKPGDELVRDQMVKLDKPRLWSPDDPFLYVLETSTGGDSLTTRFGMREFRFDRATRRALLNGKPFYLRGSNITLHRFFEDPKAGALPWDEKWVRRLLVDIPKDLSWNAFRFCVGPVPDKWLDIADESGLLIQNEYFYWTKRPTDSVHMTFDNADLIRQLGDWMRDNWNHPSVVIWDANNESIEPAFRDKIIPSVRHLDLSNRPWENGWNPAVAPDDPIEDHLYEFNKFAREFPSVHDGMLTLDERAAAWEKRVAQAGHPRILNEYGWIWVNRDGTPTELTKSVFKKLPDEAGKPETTIEVQNYLLAGVTEFWRSTRIFAGVLHFVYLTSSDPGAFTADHFKDIETLQLHEPFRRYMREAFKPLGVCAGFWQRTATPGSRVTVPVTLTNDHTSALEGTVEVHVAGEPVRRKFEVAAGGTARIELLLDLPAEPGDYLMVITASARGVEPTRCVRKFRVAGR